MPTPQKSHEIQNLSSFEPAQLSKGKEWIIYYYVINPELGKLVRKRIKCNRIKNKAERLRYAKHMIKEINSKLYSGWNPFIESSAPRSLYKIYEVLDIFLRKIYKDFRPDTYRAYTSFSKLFKEYLKEIGKQDILVCNFGRNDARDYMFKVSERDISNRTFNNYLMFYNTFWNWMKDNGYSSENVFEYIKKKKKTHKRRIQFIEDHDRKTIVDYFRSDNYNMYILSMLAYHCLIRRKELTFLQIKHIDIENSCINLDGSWTKNGNDRTATIPDIFISELKSMNLDRYSKETYLFSNDNLRPGRQQLNPKRITDRWSRMRKHTKLNDKIQFYSLRDCGIIQKIRDGVPPDIVMYQADHHSIEVTNEYIRIANPGILQDIKNKSTAFQ